MQERHLLFDLKSIVENFSTLSNSWLLKWFKNYGHPVLMDVASIVAFNEPIFKEGLR